MSATPLTDNPASFASAVGPNGWHQTPADAPENGEPAPEFQFDQTVSW
jgi:hypothetical protein